MPNAIDPTPYQMLVANVSGGRLAVDSRFTTSALRATNIQRHHLRKGFVQSSANSPGSRTRPGRRPSAQDGRDNAPRIGTIFPAAALLSGSERLYAAAG